MTTVLRRTHIHICLLLAGGGSICRLRRTYILSAYQSKLTNSDESDRGTAYCLGEILVSQISSLVEGEGILAERRVVRGKIHLNEVIVSVKDEEQIF